MFETRREARDGSAGSRPWRLLSIAVLFAAILGLGVGCAKPPEPTPLAPEDVRDRAVEWVESAETAAVGPHYRWVYYDGGMSLVCEPVGHPDRPPWDPMFVEGESFIFAGGSVNGKVSEWVRASIPLIARIYKGSDPETAWLATQHALTYLSAARLRSPLNMIERMRTSGEPEDLGDTVVLRGSVTRLDLIGTDLPAEALERYAAQEAARQGGTWDLVLTVSAADGAPVSLEVRYPQPAEPIVEAYTWERADGHASPPEDPVDLPDWGPAKEALSARLRDSVGAVERALGLPAGALEESPEPTVFPEAVSFRWERGMVELDEFTGRVVSIVAGSGSWAPGSEIAGKPVQEERAVGVLGRLGYDVAALEAGGYSLTLSEFGSGTYRTTWEQFTPSGVFTGAMVDLEIDPVDAAVARFLASASMAPEGEGFGPNLTETEAVDLAKAAAAADVPWQVERARLMYSAKPLVTGGGLRLVYMIHLYFEADVVSTALVVVDAVTGEVRLPR